MNKLHLLWIGAVFGAGLALLHRAKKHSQQFMSAGWLNDQERQILKKAGEFEIAPVDWSQHRWR